MEVNIKRLCVFIYRHRKVQEELKKLELSLYTLGRHAGD